MEQIENFSAVSAVAVFPDPLVQAAFVLAVRNVALSLTL